MTKNQQYRKARYQALIARRDAMIASLTKDHALCYGMATDKLTWIEYNICDPANVDRKWALMAERALLKMVA